MKIRSGDTKIPGQYKSQPKEKKKNQKQPKTKNPQLIFSKPGAAQHWPCQWDFDY